MFRGQHPAPRILCELHIFHKTALKHEAVPLMVRIPDNQQITIHILDEHFASDSDGIRYCYVVSQYEFLVSDILRIYNIGVRKIILPD